MLDPKISLYSECKDDLDVWSKKFCFKTVHAGINKLASNNSSIECHESVMDGIREYHASVLSNVEINNCKVALAPKVQLNKNDISEVQSAVLKAFKESNDDKNPYAMLNKHYGKYYFIMHDSIQKFSQELNGSMIRTVSLDNNVVKVPWSLANIERGSLNAEKLVKHLTDLLTSTKPVLNNAFSAVFTEVKKRTQKC